jgi:hypothetical protein
MKPEFERFINKVDQTDGCWNWLGSTDANGYGQFRRLVNGKWTMYKTHRFSYEHFKGEIPPQLLILHSCDNRQCVNPEHLRYGTHQDNVDDMMSRNRKVVGKNPNHNNLTHERVAAIRKAKAENPKLSGRALACQYNTSPSQISRLLLNQTWKVIPEEL